MRSVAHAPSTPPHGRRVCTRAPPTDSSFLLAFARRFGTIWSWVKPMLNPAIEEKLTISTGPKPEKMFEIIAPDQLPEEYGGTSQAPFGKSLLDTQLRNHVLSVLEKNGLQMKPFV